MNRVKKMYLAEILACVFSFLLGCFSDLHASGHKSFNISELPLPSYSVVRLSGFLPIPGAREDLDFTKVWKFCTFESEGRKALFVGNDNWFDYPNLFMPEFIGQKILLEDEENSEIKAHLGELLKSRGNEDVVSFRTAFGPFRVAKRCLNPEKKHLRKYIYVYQYEPYFEDNVYVSGSSEERGEDFVKGILDLL